MIAEFTANLYVIFLLLFFPLLDLSIIGMRTFFLWFATNQAVMSASKAKSYLTPVENKTKSSVVTYHSACEMAQDRANQVRSILSGIRWQESENNPDVQIVREPINPKAVNAQPEAIFSRGHGAPLVGADSPDPSRNMYICRVVIKGQVDPFITVPWFDVPGLSRPIEMTVASQAQYENVAGLGM